MQSAYPGNVDAFTALLNILPLNEEATLVSNNEWELARVPDLVLENWV